MSSPLPQGQQERVSVEIRVRGRVQGVGFRPAVWRLAQELQLTGEVRNDPDGVVIATSGRADAVARMIERLRQDAPPLARIEQIEMRPKRAATNQAASHGSFRIAPTIKGNARTQIAPDAAVCANCARETLEPAARRWRYPFTNCTQCGPRLSIVTAIPFDRYNTTMAPFALCDDCAREYHHPADRRFHAEAIACSACGPQVRLVWLQGKDADAGSDELDAAVSVLAHGLIVAIKGLGGYQLAGDASNPETLARLRRVKNRPAKPFALMARDLAMIRRYCEISGEEVRLLTNSEAPIVLLRANGPQRLPDPVAPGLRTLGFMLPTTPLHLLLLRHLDRPLVITSGNIADEPQIIEDAEALRCLSAVADAALVHDRRIAVRVDDSVVRLVDGVPRLLRRARGYAPAPIKLPVGFAGSPQVLALGSDLKSTFCLIKDGQAVLSQHQGDLDSAATFDDFRRNLAFYAELFDHRPVALAADRHPEYRASKLASVRARRDGLPLIVVQHHHAHVAACLAENGRPLASPPVLGIVLDGVGWGDDGTIWGGEFLLADYSGFVRLGTFKPVPMIGGDQAARQPWRSLYAHLTAATSWDELSDGVSDLELFSYLAGKPRAALDRMVCRAINAPPASSCGRLFDAVAAALGICRDRQLYEGEAASRLEALLDDGTLAREQALAYPFTICNLPGSELPYIEPLVMWQALLGDLILKVCPNVIAARFHHGLARAVAAMAVKLAEAGGGAARRFDTVALSGGCFQNAALHSAVARELRDHGLAVLSHGEIPTNDGGLSLGQAVVAAARLIAGGCGSSG